MQQRHVQRFLKQWQEIGRLEPYTGVQRADAVTLCKQQTPQKKIADAFQRRAAPRRKLLRILFPAKGGGRRDGSQLRAQRPQLARAARRSQRGGKAHFRPAVITGRNPVRRKGGTGSAQQGRQGRQSIHAGKSAADRLKMVGIRRARAGKNSRGKTPPR